MSVGYPSYKQKKVFYLKRGSGRLNSRTIERMSAAFKGGLTAVFATACAGVFVARTVTAFTVGVAAGIICTVVVVFVAGMTEKKE